MSGDRNGDSALRALLKKPKILILDDSTSAVDTKTDALIRKAFAEKSRTRPRLSLHSAFPSVQDADQIVILDGGTVAGCRHTR